MMKARYKSSGKLVQVERQSVARLEEHGVLDSLVVLCELVANSSLEEDPKLHMDMEELEHSSLLEQIHVRTRA